MILSLDRTDGMDFVRAHSIIKVAYTTVSVAVKQDELQPDYAWAQPGNKKVSV